jgi:hypothetical protein
VPSQRQREAATARVGVTVGGAALDKLRDADSVQLQRMARKLGNGQVASLVAGGTAKRDALLQFLGARLDELARLQAAEATALYQVGRDRLDIARRKPGATLPDPTRWRRPAELYGRAAVAIGGGHLASGAALLKDAVEAERAARAAMPASLRREAAHDAVSLPVAVHAVEPGEGCAAAPVSELVDAADAIAAGRREPRDLPVPRAGLPAWWGRDLAEEGAEEGDEKKDEEKKKERGGKKRG